MSMKNQTLRLRLRAMAAWLLFTLALPLTALATDVVVADQNGNELIYSFDDANGPASFTGIKTYATDEAKRGHIIIADNVTDADGKRHEVKYVSGSVKNRSNLVSIVFGQNIVATGGPDGTKREAFNNCRQLKTVKLNAKLETLGAYTFQYCYALEDINLGDCNKLSTIMTYALADCDHVRQLAIPRTVNTIGEWAFYSIDSLRTVTFATGSQLTSIDKGAFRDCKMMESFNIEACTQLKNFPEQMLYNCPSLKSLTVPALVETFGSNMLSYSNNIETITFLAPTVPESFYSSRSALTTVNIGPGVKTISKNAFRENAKMTKLNIDPDVSDLTIGYSAFYNCDGMETLSLPKGVTTLEEWAFENIDSLRTVTFATGSQITSMGKGVFRDCKMMESINIEACTQLKNFPEQLFYNCPSLKSLTVPASVESFGGNILSYTNNIEAITFLAPTVPESFYSGRSALTTVNIGPGVKTIGKNAFRENASLTKVTIDAGVSDLDIGNYAFYSCQALEALNLPKGVKSIGDYAFEHNYSMAQLTFDPDITDLTIGQSAFVDCDKITELVLPKGLVSMKDGVFNNIDSLRTVTFAEGCVLKVLPRDCFGSNHKLEKVTLADPLETIGIGMFWECHSLKEVYFGSGLKEIVDDWGIFNNCPLEKLVLPGVNYPFTRDYNFPGSVRIYVHPDLVNIYRTNNFTKRYHIIGIGQPTSTTIATTAGGQLEGKIAAWGDPGDLQQLTVSGPLNGTDINFIHQQLAFIEVLDLSNARIVSGGDEYAIWQWNGGMVTQDGQQTYPTQDNVVGDYMFRDMPLLREIYLPSGTTAIGYGALAQNRNVNFNLVKADIPSGVKSIGEYAFYYAGITETNVPAGVTELKPYVFWHCEKLQRAALPEGITVIGPSAFSECYSLEEVNMPSTVERIAEYAFYNNKVRTTPIVFPTPLKSIGNYAFAYNNLVKSITFNHGLESIGSWAFHDCHSVESVTLPETITYLADRVFQACDSLTEFTFPASITAVPEAILNHCDKLQKVTLANGTTSIGAYAFENCPQLATMNLTEQTSLTSMNIHAFGNTGFTTVTLPNSLTEIGYSAFRECKNLQSINVPTQLTTVPYDFVCYCPNLTSVKMHDGIRVVGHYAFLGCPSLTDIELNDDITTIEYDAFNGCTSLPLTKLPAALTFIGSSAFRGCQAMNGKLTIHEGVTRIDGEAFRETGIEAVSLPESLTSCGDALFCNCTLLRSVFLPKNFTDIKNYMFQYCSALEQIDLPETVTRIGYAAFDHAGLTSVELPEGIQKCEGYSFSNTQLRTFRVPDGFTDDLGARSFENCKQLRTIYFGRNQDYSQWSSFTAVYGCDSLQLMRVYAGTPPQSDFWNKGFRFNCVLEVPEDLVPAYLEANFWKDFKEIRGFYTGDVLREQDYAVMRGLYDKLGGASWIKVWDLENDHHSVGKWPGVTTEKVGDLTYAISSLDLSNMGLTGELSQELFRLKNLKKLNLSRNHISGDLGQLVSGIAEDKRSPLTDVNLQGNEFTGDVYAFASALPGLTNLNLGYNRMTEVSQPVPNTTLKGDKLNLEMQFFDWHTRQLVPEAADLAIDLTAGVPGEIELPTTFTYRHYEQDYGRKPANLNRIYNKSNNNWTYAWELRQTDGLWNIDTEGDRFLHTLKDQPTAYGYDWRTVILRFTWEDGDVNADQTVDVTDLQSVINFAFNDRKYSGETFNYGAADVNADDKINVIDVVGSVDYVLAYKPQSASLARIYNIKVETDVGNVLSLEGAGVVLHNTADVAALQLTISGATERDVIVGADVLGRFKVAMRQADDGLRIVVYSPEGHMLTAGEHQLLASVPAGATVSDVCLSDAKARRLGVLIENNGVSGISQLMSTYGSDVQVFDLSGRRVGQWQSLPAGVYVVSVNGKQYKVKK